VATCSTGWMESQARTMSPERPPLVRRRFVRPVLAFALRATSRAAGRLTEMGERHGMSGLVYNPLTFLFYLGCSLANAPGVMGAIRGVVPEARRYVDVGAGSGGFAALARRRGIDVEACEHSRVGRFFSRLLRVPVSPFDLAQSPPASLGGGFDLAYCFEVAEHVPAPLGDRLVQFLSDLAPLVVFTAAQPGQGGTGHVNEQPPAYWIERFEAAGMRYEDRLTQDLSAAFQRAEVAPWFANNVIVFSNPRHAGETAVRRRFESGPASATSVAT
jgi:SAM-dependent methyltransferase